jgi:hypothetical protein
MSVFGRAVWGRARERWRVHDDIAYARWEAYDNCEYQLIRKIPHSHVVPDPVREDFQPIRRILEK